MKAQAPTPVSTEHLNPPPVRRTVRKSLCFDVSFFLSLVPFSYLSFRFFYCLLAYSFSSLIWGRHRPVYQTEQGKCVWG
jgi:hypothetical protein